MPGAVRCLSDAAQLLREDPVGLLLPAGGALLLDAAPMLAAPHLWPSSHINLVQASLTLATLWLVSQTLKVALRSRMIAVGARAAGVAASRWGRPAALLGVQLVISPLALLALLAFALPLAAVAAAAMAQGLLATGAVLFAAGALSGTAAALTVRAIFSLAPSLAVVGRWGALAALRESARRCPSEIGGRLLMVLTGDVLVAAGGLLCGAGGLPGYPITDLALFLSWQGDRRETP